jgi:hypothetical protein
MNMPRKDRAFAVVALVLAHLLSAAPARAQSAAEMAKKLQDPLANIQALMTDNDINFNTGTGETSYGFQLQPVYAVPFEDAGFNLINRAVIPILGLQPLASKPPLVDPQPRGGDLTWGLSDIMLQFFFSPRTEGAWKWGIGPTFSLKTRTDSDLAGPGWGAGPIFVLVGGAGNLSIAAIGGHLWAEEGFSTSILQPMLFYNIGTDGWTVHYNNIISYDWNASSGNEWTVPLGLGVSKTFALKSGLGIEPLLGYYYNAARPAGAADHVIKWSVNILF